MADDKLKADLPVVNVLSSDSELSGRDDAIQHKKMPWWSYIWVS